MSEFCELSVDFRKISVCERVPLGTCVGETQRTGPEGYPRSRRYYPQITQITQISVLFGVHTSYYYNTFYICYFIWSNRLIRSLVRLWKYIRTLGVDFRSEKHKPELQSH